MVVWQNGVYYAQVSLPLVGSGQGWGWGLGNQLGCH